MIERKFIKHNVTEHIIREFVNAQLGRAGIGNIKLQMTPLGEKIIVYSSNPGLVVGKEGANIKKLTLLLKKRFKLENPQIEISEVTTPNASAQIVADKMAGLLERYGSNNFKGTMHRSVSDVLHSGVKGVEIVLSGKLPGSRAKTWRILSGYMKKCGDIAVVGVDFGMATARLKSGVVGVKVRIMPSDIVLPDTVIIPDEEALKIIEEEGKEKAQEEKNKEEAESEKKEEKKTKKEPKKTIKKAVKKSKSPDKKEQKEEVKENDKKS